MVDGSVHLAACCVVGVPTVVTAADTNPSFQVQVPAGLLAAASRSVDHGLT